MVLQEEISTKRETIDSVFFILLKYFTAPLEHLFLSKCSSYEQTGRAFFTN